MAVDKKLFAKNSLTGVGQKLLIALLTFYTIPVFIKLLGKEAYGVFATLSVIGELSRLTNVGFNASIVKFISKQGKIRQSSQDIVVAVFTMLVLITIISSVFLSLRELLLASVFNIPDAYLEDSRTLFSMLVFANATLLLVMPFTAILESQKRIYILNYLQLTYSILYWGLIILALQLNLGLASVGYMAFAAASIFFILTVSFSIKVWGKFHLKGISRYFKTSLKKQLGYGLQIYLSGFLGLFWEPLIILIINHTFGVASVTYYDVGIRIRNQITRINQSFILPLFQLFSERGKLDEIRSIIIVFKKYYLLGAIPVIAFLFYSTRPIIELWIGKDVESYTSVVLALSAGVIMGQVIVSPIFTYLRAFRPMALVYNQIIMIFMSVVPILATYKFLGYNSVVLAIYLSYFTQFLLSHYYARRFIKLPFITDINNTLKTLMYGVLLFFVGGVVAWALKGSTWSLISTEFTVITLFSFALIKLLKIISNDEIVRIVKNERYSKLLSSILC